MTFPQVNLLKVGGDASENSSPPSLSSQTAQHLKSGVSIVEQSALPSKHQPCGAMCHTFISLSLPSVSLSEDGLRAMLKENESQGNVSEEDWNAFEVTGNAERLMGKDTGRSGCVLTCLFAFKHESLPVDLRRESRSIFFFLPVASLFIYLFCHPAAVFS